MSTYNATHSSHWIPVFFSIITFTLAVNASGQEKLVTLKGHVQDASNGSPLIGVNVSVQNAPLGTSTDGLGKYHLNLKPGRYSIVFSCVGYKTETKRIVIDGTVPRMDLSAALAPSIYVLNDVAVNANREGYIHSLDTLKAIDLQRMPTLFSNVLGSIKILPGVSSNSELSSSYNVRGGNFDENLIYINGFEIYQPFLIQQDVEQSQSIINENMVNSMEFYHAGFPVQLGDKMSSALAVKYHTEESPDLGGELHADLFNAGLTLHDKMGRLSWRTGIRYAYPALFEKSLQTSGLYHPSFGDLQFQGSYDLHDGREVQLLFITARNDFTVTPQSAFGKISTTYAKISPSALAYTGNSAYTYATTVAGLKFITPLNDNSSLTTSLAYTRIDELYSKYYSYNVISFSDTYPPQGQGQYSRKQYEVTDNSLNSKRIEVRSDYTLTSTSHTIKTGLDIRYAKLESSLDRATLYSGTDSRLHALNSANQLLNTTFNSVSAYVEDNILFNTEVSVNAGVRALKYFFNDELLVSPRAGITYRPSIIHSFSLTWGFYYQPPYFYETWDKNLQTAKSLSAQKDVQYNLSWEYRFRERARFTAEVYYKDLSRLIPYYLDQMRLTYGTENNYKGFAAGMDLQYEGELIRGLRSWIGYSYLNAEEKETSGTSSYKSRPLEQTHTVRVFLQDHGKVHPNFQVHVLFLVGSGYHYYPMITVPGATPGSYDIVPDVTRIKEYPVYERVDMGLTYEIPFDDGKGITLTAEVLNVFDKYNISSYSWYVFQGHSKPELVPNILSPRYYNAGFKFDF